MDRKTDPFVPPEKKKRTALDELSKKSEDKASGSGPQSWEFSNDGKLDIANYFKILLHSKFLKIDCVLTLHRCG